MRLLLIAAAILAVGAILVPAASARTAPSHSFFHQGARHIVFVQNDNLAGNQVVVYKRAADGMLAWKKTYATGGLGGMLTGSVVDHLASQGSLTYDRRHALLFAVNAGSNTVSVFTVRGDRLHLVQVLSSGGTFPASVAVHGELVYVLNALNGGSVQGFVVRHHGLAPIWGSNRALGLDPMATPQFTRTPGQVAFSPDGRELIVTTKANTNAVDVFRVRRYGRLSDTPVVNTIAAAVPFAVSFNGAGNLIVAEAGPNVLASFTLNWNRTITPIVTVPTGQAATCWVTRVGSFFYASNAGTPSVSGFQSGPGGSLSLLGNTATDPGAVDSAASWGGQYLYVQTGGNGIVDEFRVNNDGSLTSIGSVTVPNAVGGEGIVAF
jgi:6-phosphogluconolactonase (cycloisomerase 2 family)